MGFGDSLTITLPPWLWLSASGDGSSARGSTREKKKSKKHGVRTRAEQAALNGSAKHGSEKDGEYYSGLVNTSGTYCFMNSTLQALASLTYLQPHIDAIHAKAEVLDVPTPIIDALQDLFRRLNTPRSTHHSIRPTEIIEVLSSQTEGRTNSLFYSREHQDAQELFQVLSECIKNEIAAVDKEGHRDRGLGGLAQVPSETMREIGKSVFDGLTANRRSCVLCGYTEAVMHFALDNWQLAVPRLATSCRLEDCLEEYTRLEILKDCICRKCSVVATHHRLLREIHTLEEATKPEARPSSSKKRRLKEVKRMEARVKAAITQGRIEDDLKDIRLEKVTSPASTKQSMIARPPPILALHINRSVHFGQYASKNTIKLIFPEVLDLTPYTTSGSLSTVPTSAISTPPPAIPRSTTPTPKTRGVAGGERTIYRLAAVVCHYGQHSFGHYIAYRRKPPLPSVGGEGRERWVPPRIVDPIKVEEMMMMKGEGGDDSLGFEIPEYVFEDDPLLNPSSSRRGRGWLRISDDSVRECGIESVLQEGSGAFMLYYERAEHAVRAYPSLDSSSSVRTTGSEETLKPEIRTLDLNGSVGSLVSEVGVGVKKEASSSSSALLVEEDKDKGKGRMSSPLVLGTSPSHSQLLGPRVVRSVAAVRARTVEREAAGSASVSSSLSSLGSLGSRSSHPSASSSSSGVTKSSSSSWPNNGLMKSPSLPNNGVSSPNKNGVTKSPSLPTTSTQPIPIPIPKNSKKAGPLQINGRPHFVEEEEMGEEGMMTASAPSILVNPKTTKGHTNTSTRKAEDEQHSTGKKPPPPPRIQSPKPIHPSPVVHVGLKA